MRALAKSRCLGDKKPLLLYGWMYERYEAQYYWYESVIILQRYVYGSHLTASTAGLWERRG